MCHLRGFEPDSHSSWCMVPTLVVCLRGRSHASSRLKKHQKTIFVGTMLMKPARQRPLWSHASCAVVVLEAIYRSAARHAPAASWSSWADLPVIASRDLAFARAFVDTLEAGSPAPEVLQLLLLARAVLIASRVCLSVLASAVGFAGSAR